MYQRLSESKIKEEIPKLIFLPIYWGSYLRKHVEASWKEFLVLSIAILIAFHRKVFALKRKVFQKRMWNTTFIQQLSSDLYTKFEEISVINRIICDLINLLDIFYESNLKTLYFSYIYFIALQSEDNWQTV